MEISHSYIKWIIFSPLNNDLHEQIEAFYKRILIILKTWCDLASEIAFENNINWHISMQNLNFPCISTCFISCFCSVFVSSLHAFVFIVLFCFFSQQSVDSSQSDSTFLSTESFSTNEHGSSLVDGYFDSIYSTSRTSALPSSSRKTKTNPDPFLPYDISQRENLKRHSQSIPNHLYSPGYIQNEKRSIYNEKASRPASSFIPKFKKFRKKDYNMLPIELVSKTEDFHRRRHSSVYSLFSSKHGVTRNSLALPGSERLYKQHL